MYIYNVYIYIFFFSLSLSMSMYASAQVSSSRSELTAWKSTLEAAHQALVDACAAAKSDAGGASTASIDWTIGASSNP